MKKHQNIYLLQLKFVARCLQKKNCCTCLDNLVCNSYTFTT